MRGHSLHRGCRVRGEQSTVEVGLLGISCCCRIAAVGLRHCGQRNHSSIASGLDKPRQSGRRCCLFGAQGAADVLRTSGVGEHLTRLGGGRSTAHRLCSLCFPTGPGRAGPAPVLWAMPLTWYAAVPLGKSRYGDASAPSRGKGHAGELARQATGSRMTVARAPRARASSWFKSRTLNAHSTHSQRTLNAHFNEEPSATQPLALEFHAWHCAVAPTL